MAAHRAARDLSQESVLGYSCGGTVASTDHNSLTISAHIASVNATGTLASCSRERSCRNTKQAVVLALALLHE